MDDMEMDGELTAVVAALGMGAPQAEKTEFMATAMVVLSQFPAALCREGLQTALTECDSLRKVLSFVKGYCEDYPDRLRRRLERLQMLAAYAEGRPNV